MKTSGFDPFTVFRAAAVCFYQKEIGNPVLHDSKNLGYCQNFDELIEQINRLGSDLIEARWNFIVIEEVGEGVLVGAVAGSERWLKLSRNTRRWEKCAKPIEAKGIIWWTI